MRIRSAIASVALGTALTVGALAVPAQATEPVTHETAPTQAMASWHTIDTFFLYESCYNAKLSLEYSTGWVLRCWGGDWLNDWQLQRWY